MKQPTMAKCLLLWHHGNRSQIPADLLPYVESHMREMSQHQSTETYAHHTVSTSMPGVARVGKVARARRAI